MYLHTGLEISTKNIYFIAEGQLRVHSQLFTIEQYGARYNWIGYAAIQIFCQQRIAMTTFREKKQRRLYLIFSLIRARPPL
jgi:hypothetical protein